MDRVTVNLKNCYGIKSLKQDFDFSQKRAYAIYAPNGAMKSSLAHTFQDTANGKESRDRIFSTRVTIRVITDERGDNIETESIFVVLPYNEQFGTSEKTSTLLVDPALREEYTQLHVEFDKAKNKLLTLIKLQSKSQLNLESEISSIFTRSENEFLTALIRIRKEIQRPKRNALFRSPIR